MAQAKKTKRSTTKRAVTSRAKKTSAAKKSVGKRPAKPRATKKALTTDARRKLLRPHTDYEKLVEQVALTWEQNRALRVPNLTSARLRRLARIAQRTATKAASLRTKLEQQLALVDDARLLAEDGVWRAVLDVNAAVKLYARSDDTLPESFGFLTEALTSARSAAASSEPVPTFTPTPTM